MTPAAAPELATAGSSRRAGRRAGRRKLSVLAAACRVIADRGAEATRFTDVAEASGVPVSTLQYYFGSREDLLVAAFRHASAEELSALETELAGVSSGWEQIRRIVRGALDGYEPGRAHAGLLWIESWHLAIRDPEMREDALRDYAGWRQLVADAIRLGTGAGEFRPLLSPEQIAVLTIALVDGAGIPLALGDPSLSVSSATSDVLRSVGALLGAAGTG